MRGTIVDFKFNVIQRTFTKIFNVGEKWAPHIEDDTICYAVRKINGFMAAATWHYGRLLVSTTGSVDSDFADMAQKHVRNYLPMMVRNPEYTFTFEIVDRQDPHVIHESPGAYLIGARLKKWNTSNHDMSETELDALAETHGILRPEWTTAAYGDIVEDVKFVEHEGYVVYPVDPTDHREVKMKSPFYLSTKFLGRKSEKRLNEILEKPARAKKILDEEFYPVIDHLATIRDEFVAMSEQERFGYLREWFSENVISEI